MSKCSMFKLFCCWASEGADKTTELDLASDSTQKLKEALVGRSETVQKAPLIVVTVVDVTSVDGVPSSSLTWTCFSIKGLRCRTRVKVLSTPMQTVECDLVVDLEKPAGVEEVVAKVVDVTSSHEAISKVMAMEVLQKHVETAISQRLLRQVAKGEELVTSASIKNSSNVQGATAKSKGEQGGKRLSKVELWRQQQRAKAGQGGAREGGNGTSQK